MFIELLKIANKLDKLGEHELASKLDEILKIAADNEDEEFLSHLAPGGYLPEPEGFMRDVETGNRFPSYLDEMVCEDCGVTMPLDIYKSAAGYYIGRFCENCGPWSRESGYYKTKAEAREDLDKMRFESYRKKVDDHDKKETDEYYEEPEKH